MANPFSLIDDDIEKESSLEAFQRSGSPTGTADAAAPRPEGTSPFSEAKEEIKPYDWQAAGIPLPRALQPVGDLIAGLNHSLANVAGIAVDDVDSIMRDLGTSGILDKPGSGREALISAMEKANIGADTKKVRSEFLGRIGEATGENLIMLAAMLAGAPTLLAAQGEGATANFSRELGKYFVKTPGTAALAETGAAVGGETGSTIGRKIGPTAEALGGMGGAMLGGGAMTMGVGGLARVATKPFREAYRDTKAIARSMREGLAKAPASSIITDVQPDVGIIQKAIQSDKARVDDIIERLSNRMTQSQDPVETTRQLQKVQRDAYNQSRSIESGYWQKVKMNRKMPTQGIKDFMNNMVKATAKEGRSEWLPTDLMAKVKSLPQNASLDRLRAIRTIAFQRIQSGTIPTPQGELRLNDTMRRNLNSLISEVDAQVEKQFPNDIELKKATEFSRWLHDRFTRGPVAQFSRPRANEGVLPTAKRSARTALEDERFGQQSADIQPKLATSAAEQQMEIELPQTTKAAEDFMRGQLNGEVERLGPEGARKFMNKPQTKAFLKAYPKLAGEFAAQSNRLDRALEYRKANFDSAFVKVINESPETYIAKTLNSSNRDKMAKALADRVRNNPDALEATKNQTILELERMADGNPANLIGLLDAPGMHTAVHHLIGEDINRLTRIAINARDLMQADKGGLPRYLVSKASKVFGALLGRSLGTGTLQAPEIGGRIVQRTVDEWMNNHHDQLLHIALRSPAGEALLNARAPQSVSELKEFNRRMKRVIRSMEAVKRSATPYLPDTEDDQ